MSVEPPRLEWQAPPATPPLPRDSEVHVWCVGLDPPAADVRRQRDLLSADERARADRFHFERDRRHFIVARGRLRTILGLYLDVSAEGVRFVYSAQGKPRLAKPLDLTALRFNVSHSGAFALVGVALDREIGIDIEQIRALDELREIAGRFFSTWEARTLLALPVDVQPVAFFNCWTRKEAYIKAVGAGVSLPLDGFDVSFVPGEPARLLRASEVREVERWTLHALDPAPGYAAALAVEGHAWPLVCWRWPV